MVSLNARSGVPNTESRKYAGRTPVDMNAHTVVLLSGGVDSAACVSFYLTLGHVVESLFVDYGQPTRNRERESAAAIAKHYSTPLGVIKCRGFRVHPAGEIPGRNSFLVLAALLHKPKLRGTVALGIHAGNPYYDTQVRFVADISRLLDGYTDGRVVLGVPFLRWHKTTIWKYCHENKVPIHLTWSCEFGPNEPCGNCLSCKDLEALDVCAKN